MPRNPAVLYLSLTLFLPLSAVAQQSRIASPIDNNRRVTLTGHISPRALAGSDQGPVDPSFVMARVTLMMRPSASQQAELDQLLELQQDPSSPNFHRWLTPEQFADRFGVSQADVKQIEAWLGTQNLPVVEVARARNYIAVTATAGALQQAFGLDIHHYLVHGELHYANANEPSIPAALQGVITSMRGLTDFRLKPRIKTLKPAAALPRYTNFSLCEDYCIGPGDQATIYDITPLHNAGLNGSGQTIVVVGQTDILAGDISQYRSFFSLPAINLQQTLVPGSADPGVSTSGDLGESDLDIEISGGVAQNATINFVYSTDVFTSLQYAVDNDLAPVITMSYGDCEPSFGQAEAVSMQGMAQQANAQGITWFAASGDQGAADCYGDGGGLDDLVAVDMPASIPQVTGVGGTQFNEGTGAYWSATNTASNASALSYIPEVAWNTTVLDGTPSASGGGASIYFSKPSWQTGEGVPNDGARDVPDVSISASDDHDPYLIFTSDPTICGTSRRGSATCEGLVGGTSVGAPSYAGLAALVNQAVVSKGIQSSPGLGNINPTLYGVFNSTPAAYHDVTSGNNSIQITCPPRQFGCEPLDITGYNAGPGYDQVTGIGSMDANALVTAWLASLNAHVTPPGSFSISGISNNGSGQQVYAPGEIISIYGTSLASSTQQATSLPLPTTLAGVTISINGTPAPLFYVSATQINAQIPYEVQAGTTATLEVSSSTGSGSFTFPVGTAAAAPGIYINQNAPVGYASAAQGQEIVLYVTGAGLVSPAVADGAAPTPGTTPVPTQSVTVTMGGVNAPIDFIGIPSWSAGVLQINCTVPTNAPLLLGTEPVVVTVGGVASNSAILTVTP
jgi:uncharacterized protein (TIGR03437 family)